MKIDVKVIKNAPIPQLWYVIGDTKDLAKQRIHKIRSVDAIQKPRFIITVDGTASY